MAQIQIQISDSPGRDQLDVEIHSSDVGDVTSPANMMGAFISKYWEVMCISMQNEFAQAAKELLNAPIKANPKLVDSSGSTIDSGGGSL